MSVPAPSVTQVWVRVDDARDQDTIVALQPTTLPGVELLIWGARGRVHTRVAPDPEGGTETWEKWPPARRRLALGPGAPWYPDLTKTD